MKTDLGATVNLDDVTEDILRSCLTYAIAAPSPHNTQPWRFEVNGSQVNISLDLSRGLVVADPKDRESLLSVGCAAFNLRVALARFGYHVDQHLLPDPKDPAKCISLAVRFGHDVDPSLPDLFDAITARRTSHAMFAIEAIDPEATVALRAAAIAEGAGLHVLNSAGRERLRSLVMAADAAQMRDRSFRRELAGWLRSDRSDRPDGLHGITGETVTGSVFAEAHPGLVRTLDLGGRRAKADQALIAGTPLLAVLTTERDDPKTWLQCGQALQRVLLCATRLGYSTGFLNQPVEQPAQRADLKRLVDGNVPQVVLRIGHGTVDVTQPRRPLDDFLDN